MHQEELGFILKMYSSCRGSSIAGLFCICILLQELANWIDTVLAIVGLVDILVFLAAPGDLALTFMKALKAARCIRLLRVLAIQKHQQSPT